MFSSGYPTEIILTPSKERSGQKSLPPISLLSLICFSALQYVSLKSDSKCCCSKLIDPQCMNTEFALKLLGFGFLWVFFFFFSSWFICCFFFFSSS